MHLAWYGVDVFFQPPYLRPSLLLIHLLNSEKNFFDFSAAADGCCDRCELTQSWSLNLYYKLNWAYEMTFFGWHSSMVYLVRTTTKILNSIFFNTCWFFGMFIHLKTVLYSKQYFKKQSFFPSLIIFIFYKWFIFI